MYGRRERLHEHRAVRRRCLENQVKVVDHAGEQVEPDVVLFDAFAQALQEALVIGIVSEQSLIERPACAAVVSDFLMRDARDGMRDALKLLSQQCDADGPKRRYELSVAENAGNPKSRISHPAGPFAQSRRGDGVSSTSAR